MSTDKRYLLITAPFIPPLYQQVSSTHLFAGLTAEFITDI